MKTSAVFGVLVLVACLYLQVNGWISRGTTDNCEEKRKDTEKACVKLSCNNKTGNYVVEGCGSISVGCPEGQVADKGEQDLTKPFPKCCAEPFCREV